MVSDAASAIGNVVIVDHSPPHGPFSGVYSLYGHLQSTSVSAGTIVGSNTVIGRVGATDADGVVHLHVEMKFRPTIGPLSDSAPPWGYSPPKPPGGGDRPGPLRLTDRPEFYGYINPRPFLDGLVQSTSAAVPVLVASGREGVYEGPSEGTDRVSRVTAGQPYYSIARGPGDWQLIVFPSSHGPASGWVRSNTSPGTAAGKLRVETEALRVRRGPGSGNSEVLDTANRGMRVWDRQLLLFTDSQNGAGCTAEWYRVPLADNAQRTSGWICGDYVNVLGTGGCLDCGGSGPDLRITAAELSESTVEPGDRLRIDVTILNDGDAVAPESRVRFYWSDDPDFDRDDLEVDANRVDELGPGVEADENDSFSVPDASPGRYYVLAVADADGEVDESNESNNIESVSVTVRGDAGGGGSDLPNLIVKSVDAPSSVEAGATLRFDFVVAELNDPDDFEQSVRTVPFDMAYYLVDGGDRVRVGGRANPTSALWPRSRERELGGRADIPAGLSPGTYEIVVEVDADDEVDESDERDNERRFTIRVEGGSGGSDLPNLVVASVDPPPSVEAGSALRFDFVVAEVNDAPDFSDRVNGVPFDMAYYLVDGGDRVRVGGRANPTGTLWTRSREREFGGRADIPPGLPAGTYQIVVEVDTNDEVDESDEDDNERAFSVEVVAGSRAEITFSSSSVDFGAVAVGQTRDVGFNVNNTGDAPLTFSAAVSGGAFALGAGSGTITVRPGSSNGITLRFRPDREGPLSGALRVTHDAPNRDPVVEIPLRGVGAEGANDPVTLALPDVAGAVGQSLRVPVDLSGLDGREVLAYQLELTYDPAVVDFLRAEDEGTLSAGWSVAPNEPTAGTVVVSGANARPFTSDGVLLHLVFDLVGDGTSALSWRSGRLNEGDPATAVSPGSVTATSCGPCGDVTGNGEVSPLDASYVLQYTAGEPPATFALCAADPTRNGEVSPLDASFILQYTAEILPELSCGTPTRVGGGAVTMAAPTGASSVAATSAAVTWDATPDGSGVWTLALSLNRPALSAALDLEVGGSAEVVVPEGALPEGWVSVVRATETGARIAFAGPTPAPSDWTVPLRLSVPGVEGASVVGSLAVDEQRAVGLPPLSLVGTPGALALTVVSPNPTDARASVGLLLPEPSPVRVDVFDVLGRRVRVVDVGQLGARPAHAPGSQRRTSLPAATSSSL